MRSWTWYLLLVVGAAALGGLVYYTLIWRHRITVVDWYTTPIWSLPDSGVPFDPLTDRPVPQPQAGETFLIVQIHRRIQDDAAALTDIRLMLPDGSTVHAIAVPEERTDEAGRRILVLAFIVRRLDVDQGGLKLRYLYESAVELPAQPQ